jgi:hypothetical protein
MSEFKIYLPDETPMSRFLHYYAKLNDDLRKADTARKNQAAKASKGSRSAQPRARFVNPPRTWNRK